MHIDRFSVGLEELSRKEASDTRTVLKVMVEHGRFSAFEASDNPTIAATVARILQGPYVTTDKETLGYPWTLIELTDEGRKFLEPKPTS